ncbi:MAG: ankyrin repeat domain-containing protein [Leptolyngbya sp. SIOISBB]|nr:ankyrin repeat domain-containing protein [Leptolyngbya sp. SIOISBB]
MRGRSRWGIGVGMTIALFIPLTACQLTTKNPATPNAERITETEPPPLIAATLEGDEVTVRSLLDAGTDPNLIYHTNTALTYAARDGHTDIARVLITTGADVNWIDGEGVTPLILAAFKGHVELAALLLNHGADTTVVDQWSQTALDYALRRGEDDAIAQLIQASQ